EYAQTAVVWMRGTLQHDHGVRPEQVRWLVGGQEEPGRRDRVDHDLPPGVPIEPLPPGKTLTGMLEAGELDAVISARVPTAFQRGSPRVRRLFQDWKAVEVEYYRRTRLFPIMHIIVLRRALYERHPWAAMSLYKAYCQAKAQVEGRILTTAYRHILPWILAELEEVRALFPNGDCFPYGLEANRHALETFLQYEQEQGLLQKPLTPEELFAPNTLEEFRI
ncbi:MAG: ABC transporter substrate-binding protein, partial [Deltaproteobacteria bacterium]|nr:ABC transporter substrate-binding protein [Deltaproteobacteria bacterium]